jgi:hypothetical protein
LHFVHNAEHLAQYPNLPSSWSRVDVYLAWCLVTMLGIVGYLLYLRDNRPGNGLLLFFRVDDFATALPRARALVAGLEEEPHVNQNTGTPEFSLRDPDGYYVTISALSAA